MTDAERVWHTPPEGCCWTWCYDDGIAVYHSLTGSTHILPTVAWQVLHALTQGCATATSVQAHLFARGWSLAHSEVEATLEALHAARLTRPAY